MCHIAAALQANFYSERPPIIFHATRKLKDKDLRLKKFRVDLVWATFKALKISQKLLVKYSQKQRGKQKLAVAENPTDLAFQTDLFGSVNDNKCSKREKDPKLESQHQF